jgi:hypothetical protein
MATTPFTSTSLMDHLVATYAHLNDNNAKAQEIYDLLMSKRSKSK